MHIICLEPLEDGVYNDHNSYNITAPPEGWAYIPEDFSLPSTFPRLGSLEAEELPYTYEVEIEKEVIKTREVPQYDENGNRLEVFVAEEYTTTEIVTEQRTKMVMTVTAMTEGILPEPLPEEVTAEDILLEMAADHEYRISLIEMGVSDLEM